MKKTNFLFPFLTVSMAFIMYFVAFHDERNKNVFLQTKIDSLTITLNTINNFKHDSISR